MQPRIKNKSGLLAGELTILSCHPRSVHTVHISPHLPVNIYNGEGVKGKGALKRSGACKRKRDRGFTVCEGVEVTNIVACLTGAKREGEG